MSTPGEWERDKEAKAGFSCLGFSMSSPQYYQYDYKAQGDAFTAIARGDLDSDSVFSEFKLGGTIVNGELRVNQAIEESNPNE